ncbi:tRNA (guanine-N(7)-)-methyltransferase (tRNA(m7G46)-methyltransferase) [Elasticomyces elasticus]|nr:tRNA (guanine-N(7)-)-methyltransferase (tRNA(m7G46)-methyltransferase) [Elasticomyces elasticus]KAK4919465.1 tRNA (guanine-N(7)-)-methyltransferase (tRNA(m7G46)-methyltransferase) [Elasticomyces elasticus]
MTSAESNSSHLNACHISVYLDNSTSCDHIAAKRLRDMNPERKYVIAAAIVAFIAWALITDWIPSLRWIPYAFVAGFLAAILGFLYLVVTTSKGVRYREDAYAGSGPLAPAFSHGKAWEEEKLALNARAEYRRPTIFPEARAFSRAVDGLLDLILRDYVTSWYGAISSRPLFQNEIDRCIRSVLLTIAARFTDIDVIELGVARVLPMITAHLRDFYEAERVVRGKTLTGNVTESEELDTAVAGKYAGGKLHNAAALMHSDPVKARQSYLRALVEKVMPCVLPANMQSSRAVTVLVREIVSCAVLGPVINMLCDPDFWNQQIVNVGGPMLQDRKTVKRVRAALDQHAPVSPKSQRSAQFPRLRSHDTERQFERFIRAIRHVMNLSEARRLRSDIVSQIRRDSVVADQDAVYLRRLETGKRLLDQKIETLSATVSKPKLAVRTMSSSPDATARKQQATLREVIYDAAGLSYVMEYLDRVKLMQLVQFYLVVDGYRFPLEGDNDEAPPGVADDRDRMDIGQMYESYLTKPELQTTEASLADVRAYLRAGQKATLQDYLVARRAVLRTQTQVYKYMKDTHFENFKKSDLFYKWLAIEEHPVQSAAQPKHFGSTLSPDSARAPSPARARRPQAPNARREPELRRAVLSSTDLRGSTKNSTAEPRRSLDDTKRSSLFGDEVEDEPMSQSLTSLQEDESDNESVQRARDEATAVEEMQTALDDIVSHEEDRTSLFSDSTGRQSLDADPHTSPQDQARPVLQPRASTQDRPSIASLGLVGAPSSRGVFVDDLFAEETQKFVEDEHEDSNGPEDSDADQVQHAAPGDLGLSEAIHALNTEIEKLNTQNSVLQSLTAKAELTNNAAELRILRKSEQSLQREIKRKEMQKQQYAVQEGDNDLYGRAQVTIKSVMIGQEDDGHEYALYVIEVRKQAGDNIPAATWAVTRRYSQFHELHKRLRARFPSVRELDFPRRQALFTLQKDFIRKRRVILERYLRSLLLVPAICHSRELRAFLSQAAIATNGTNGQVDAKDFVTRIYNSVSDGMEEFLGNIPVLDQLSVAGQNLISAASAQVNGAPIDILDPATHDPATAGEAEAELNAYEAKEAEPFVKPICDLFLETFELSKGNSWLRGRTVVVVLHQLLGGTIERKVRESAKNSLEDASLASYVGMLRDAMWPDGRPRPASVPRNTAEKMRTRKEAGLILGALIPDLAGSVVGRTNAQAASRKIVAVVNNQRLNAHTVFTLIDEVIRIVFPETLKS